MIGLEGMISAFKFDQEALYVSCRLAGTRAQLYGKVVLSTEQLTVYTRSKLSGLKTSLFFFGCEYQ